MFGLNINKKSKKTGKSAGLKNKSCVGTGKGQRSSADIRSEALARVASARENLGSDTIQKITQSIQKMEQQNAKMAMAKKKLATEADAELVAYEILSMIGRKK